MFRRVLYSILSILVCLFLAAACTGPEMEPVKPDVPEQPENPDQPDQPDQPDNPDNPVDPDNPDTPEEPEALVSGELPEGDYTLRAGTIYLPDSFVETVTEHDKAFGFFKTTSKALPKEGDVLVYNKFTEQFPEGFLGKVSRVEDGYVYYDPVPLEEAFTHLQIDTTSLNLADNVAYVVDGEGKPVSFTKTRAMATSGIGIAIPSNVTWDLYSSGYNYEGLEANVKMTLTPSMNVYLGMRFQAVIDNGEVLAMNFVLDPVIHLGATINVYGELAATKSFPLYTFYFNPVALGPLVFIPKITLEGFVKIDGQIGLEVNVSYDKSFSIGAGYQTGDWRFINRGIDSPLLDHDPCSFGPKVEGGITFGLKPALEFRLYDILGVSVGAETGLRTAVTYKMDMANPDVTSSALSDFSMSTALNIKGFVEMNAKVGGTVLYQGYSKSTPEKSFTLYESWLMPEICTSTMKIEPAPRGATVSGMLKRNVFTKGALYAHVFDPTDYEHDPVSGAIVYPRARIVPVSWTAPRSKKDSTEFSVSFEGFEPGVTYQVNMFMSVLGSRHVPVRGDSTLFFRTFNEKQAKAVASLVSNVAEAMGWYETPWYDVSPSEVLYMQDKGINVTTSEDGGTLEWVTLRPDRKWPLKSHIVIGPTVGSSLEDGQWWQLFGSFPEEESDNVTSLIINDPTCAAFSASGKNLQHLEIHSPYYKGSIGLGYGYPKLRELDMSGTGITSIIIGDDDYDEHVPDKLTSIKFDNCTKLESISIDYPYRHDVPSLSINGCAALKKLEYTRCAFQGDPPVTGIKMAHMDNIRFYKCDGTLNLPAGCETVTISDKCISLSIAGGNPNIKQLTIFYESSIWGEYEGTCFENVTLSNLPGVENELDIRGKNVNVSGLGSKQLQVYAIETAEVASCANLERLEMKVSSRFALSGLGSFPGLPQLKAFSITPDLAVVNGEYTCALNGLVPEIIDRVRNKGGSVSYPIRYRYIFDKTLGDRGRWRMDYDYKYGFYYSGEPSPRCYHYPKPDNYDQYND